MVSNGNVFDVVVVCFLIRHTRNVTLLNDAFVSVQLHRPGCSAEALYNNNKNKMI